MARWCSLTETIRKRPPKRFGRKWQNASTNHRLFLRDRLGFQKPTEFIKVSVFNRLALKRRCILQSGFKHGVSPLISDRLKWSKFQKKLPFYRKSEFCKESNYRRVKHSKKNIFVEIDKNPNLLKSEFNCGASLLNRNRLIVLESNSFKKESVFDRLGNKKRSNFEKGIFCHSGNIFVKIDNDQDRRKINIDDGGDNAYQLQNDVHSIWDDINSNECKINNYNEVQPQTDAQDMSADFSNDEISNNECKIYFNGNIFVEIANDQDRRKISIDDGGDNDYQFPTDVQDMSAVFSNECLINNYSEVQPQTDVQDMSAVFSNECLINNYNEVRPQTDVQDMSAVFSNEEISSNEYKIDNYKQLMPPSYMHNLCDVSRDDSSNECVSDNLSIATFPGFISEIFPAESFVFDDGVRSSMRKVFC